MEERVNKIKLLERCGVFEDYKYLPWQPGFERTAGRYRGRIAESQDGMAGIVADFYEIDGRKLREGKIPVIPDGCTDLIFVSSGRESKVYVSAGVMEPQNFQFTNPESIFGVRFMPGATCHIFHNSIGEIVYKPTELKQFLRDTKGYTEKIVRTPDFEQKIHLAVKFVRSLLLEEDGSERIVGYCCKRMYETRGLIAVKKLAVETGYTERYLDMLFERYVGTSPKNLCNIIKVQYAYLLMKCYPGLPLSYVAQCAGYADHSHMNRVFGRYLKASAGTVRDDSIFQKISQEKTIVFA